MRTPRTRDLILCCAGLGLASACVESDDTADALPPSAAASATGIELPIEVAPDTAAGLGGGYIVTRAFSLTQNEINNLAAGGNGVLYLQGHGLGYRDGNPVKDGKASVLLGTSGIWYPLTTAGVHLFPADAYYDGIGGGFRSVRMTIDLSAVCGGANGVGCLHAGTNTISFRWNGTDGTGSGYRILAFNLKTGAGIDQLTGFTKAQPTTWTKPFPAAADVAEGARLWSTRGLLLDRPGGHHLVASCADCHAHDALDLAYFAFSNDSIANRAVFHGLSKTQGLKIASFVRDQSAYPWGRPWDPPFQPGRALLGRPAEAWAAGAGLDAVLDHEDTAMLDQIFPDRSSTAAMAASIRGTGLDARTIDLRQLPVAIQLPDWNSWLPEVHPLDLWGGCYWEGTGNGQFATHVDQALPPQPAGLATADFDEDGVLDAAVARTASNLVDVLRGVGDGTFTATTTGAIAGGAIAAGDLDGDGHQDLAIATTLSSNVGVLFGRGDGTFLPLASAAAGGVSSAIAIADVDGDGRLDIAVLRPTATPTLTVIRRGAAGFLAPVSTTLPARGTALALGDLDGDGRLDAVVSFNATNKFGVLHNLGAGAFSVVAQLATAAAPQGVAVADVDLDGDLDVAVTAASGGDVEVRRNDGTGALGAAQPLTGLASPAAVAVRDVDSDGQPDLIVAESAAARVRVMRADGNGGYATLGMFAVGDQPSAVAVVDLDGDPRLDLIVADRGLTAAPGAVSTLRGDTCRPSTVPGTPIDAYVLARATIPTLGLPADVAQLPDLLGHIHTSASAFVGIGMTVGAAGQPGFRSIRSITLDAAVQRGYSYELVKRSLAQWVGVKLWELVRENSLETYGKDLYGPDGEAWSWPMGANQAVHSIAPHITSGNLDHFTAPSTYGADDACPSCTEMSVAQTEIKGDYDSTAWYHLQILLHAGARSVLPGSADEAVSPVDWPYSLIHIDDVARDIDTADPLVPAQRLIKAPWESLRFVATWMKAYQERDNGRGPALVGWSLRDVSPRILVGNWRGDARATQLLENLDNIEPGLRAKVTNAFLRAYMDVVTSGPSFATWTRYDPANTDVRQSWWKLDPRDYKLQCPSSMATLFASGPHPTDPAVTTGFFHHADQLCHAIPLLDIVPGVDHGLVTQLDQWAALTWPNTPVPWDDFCTLAKFTSCP